MLYYEIMDNGTIGRSTNSEKVARQLHLTQKTDKEIVYAFDGHGYIKGTEPPTPEKNYAEKRAEVYPSIADQLDMIYWDFVNGTERWREAIGAVKMKYPK